MRIKLTLIAALACVLTTVTQPAGAVDKTWDGNGDGDGDGTTWSTGNASFIRENWSDNAAFITGDNATFVGTAGLLPSIGGSSLAVGSVAFAGGAGAFTVGGTATLTINGGILNNDGDNQSFSVSTITLGASQTWNAAAGNLTFSGTTLNLGSSQTLTVSGANNVSIANSISGISSGITKNGAGTLTLSGANGYTGNTTLNAGAITLGTPNALGSGNFIFAGGTLNGNNRTDNSIGALSLTADSTLNLVAGTTSSLIFSSASWTDGFLTINNWSGIEEVAGDDDRIFITGTVGAGFTDHVLFQLDSGLYFGMMSGSELVPSLTPVPEPTEWALIIFATLAVLYKFAWPRLRGLLARG